MFTLFGNFKRELGDFIASHRDGRIIKTDEVKQFFKDLDLKK